MVGLLDHLGVAERGFWGLNCGETSRRWGVVDVARDLGSLLLGRD